MVPISSASHATRTVSQFQEEKVMEAQSNRVNPTDGFLDWEKIAWEAQKDETAEPSLMPRADEMTPSQHETFAKKYLLVCLMIAGTPIAEAISRCGLQMTKSGARKLRRQFEERGADGLIDHRINNKKPKAKLLTDEIKKRALAWWFARPAAGPRAIWKQIVEELKQTDVPQPGYDVMKKYFEDLPAAYKLFRQGKLGVHEWERSFCPVVRFNLTTYSNQRWQIDNSRLDIWVRVWDRDEGRWVPAQAHICACFCSHSHTIPGFNLSAKDPDSWTTALMLMKAIKPKENSDWKNKGLPGIIQPDRGKTFLAHAVIASLAYLGVAIDPDPPYYPNRKGKIERWFLTLDRGCLRILPGHMAAIGKTRQAAEKHIDVLLTVPQLRTEIERWIVSDYHQQTSTETRRKPTELWEETVRLRMPESEDAMNLMLLKNDQERTVHNTGITFKFPGASEAVDCIYWAPELTYSVGEKVRLRYNPEDSASVLVYSAATEQYICEAWIMNQTDSRYTIADVSQSRTHFRRGLKQRIKDYVAEIERSDRQRASSTAWEEARVIVEKEDGEDLRRVARDQTLTDSLLEAMIDQFNRQDEGGDHREVA